MHLPRPERTTDLLLRAVTEGEAPRMTVHQLIGALGDRAFGLVMLLFALPNCIPSPPGIGSLLGVPLFLFSLQLILGQHQPWVPGWIGRRDFAKLDLRRIIVRATPYIRKFEAVCTPRLRLLTEGIFLRLLGVLIFLLSILIVLPFPGTNWLPAVVIAIISLALVERDGLIILASFFISVATLYFTSKFVYAGMLWLIAKVQGYFS